MNRKIVFLSALCFFSITQSNPGGGSSNSSFLDNIDMKKVGIGGVFCAGGTALWWLYSWYNQEISNEKLAEQAQNLYEAVHTKHGSITFLYRPELLQNITEMQLSGLVDNPDMYRLKDVTKDLPQLNRMIQLLQQGIRKEDQERRSKDKALLSCHKELISLRDKLKMVATFWHEHGSFFDLHQLLKKVAARYAQVRGSVSQLFDFCMKHPKDSVEDRLSRLVSGIQQDVYHLRHKADSCERYVVLFGSASALIEELNQVEENARALLCFFRLENEFNKFDSFARKLSFQNPQDLAAKIKGVHGNKQYPFTSVAQEARDALSLLENRRNAVTGSAVLFDSHSSFSPRVYDLLKRVDDLTAFLMVLRDTVVSSYEYENDGKKQRKDQHHEKELALERERIRKEDERNREKLRLEKERLAKEEKREQEKIRVEREKAFREQQAKQYEADQKVREAAIARDKAKREKEIQELKTQEAIARVQAAQRPEERGAGY